MTVLRVQPTIARGRLTAPPSKSYTHRALVAGYLARRPYRVERPLEADDTRATARALARLGSRVDFGAGYWTVRPRIRRPTRSSVRIDCRESGTTLRFVAALAALEDRPVTLEGRGRLPRRPMERLLGCLRSLGATCHAAHPYAGIPLTVRGPIRPGQVRLDASESSQFASALLLVLPILPGPSSLELTGRVVSRPYLDATVAVLRHHGIRLTGGHRRFRVPGPQSYSGHRFEVPGDASSAAYFWTAAALTGGRVRVDGIPFEWPQADLAILNVLARAGAQVLRTRSSATVVGAPLHPFSVDLTDCPDLYPLVGVLAASIPGRSLLCGAPHVVHKESDRRRGTARLARALGAHVRPRGTGLAIEGSETPRAVTVRDLSDHRLVMSAAVGALSAAGSSRIGDARAVRKSYPGFWNDFGTIAPGSLER